MLRFLSMCYKLRHILMLFLGGFLFLLDRFLKWQAFHGWNFDRLVTSWLGWHPFTNRGIAFSLPIPNWLQIGLTIPVLVVLIFFLIKNFRSSKPQVFKTVVFTLVIGGALSNLIDRVLYQYTIDYVLIVTSIINLADVMIVAGFVVYFIYNSKAKSVQ